MGNLVERVHLNLKTKLLAMDVKLDQWSEFIEIVKFQVNNQPHSSLNDLSPYEALYGRPMFFPSLDFEKSTSGGSNSDDWITHIHKWVENTGLELGHLHCKRFFDKNNDTKIENKYERLKRGTKVAAYQPMPIHTSKKLYRSYHGPFEVVKNTSKNVYLVRNTTTRRHLKRHRRHLRILK